MSAALSAFERAILSALASRAAVAGRILDAWADQLSPSAHTPRSLAALAQLTVTEERAVAEMLEAAAMAGLVAQTNGGFVAGAHPPQLFKRLSLALHAIAHYQEAVHRDSTTARVVLTKPPTPCVLDTELHRLGWRATDVEATERAFKRLAQLARERIVVMTPFFDLKGADWLKSLLEGLSVNVTKLLVLRSLERPQSPDYPVGYDALKAWLLQEGVQVWNYSVARPAGFGRETFHAKVVLCDQSAAYLGSSNITAASLEHSMEMGVELVGKAAQDVAVVMQAVLASSSRLI